MNEYEIIKKDLAQKRANNKFITTKSDDLLFQAEIDTQKQLLLFHTCEPRNQYGYITSLPTKLDDMVALRNHLIKIIFELTLPEKPTH